MKRLFPFSNSINSGSTASKITIALSTRLIAGLIVGLGVGALLGLGTGLVGCSSDPVQKTEIDPLAHENAIFACKREIQNKKKAYFASLPPLLQRIAGENQILKEFSRPPSKADIARAIARFPLAGDSGGLWKTRENAQLRTVSTQFENQNVNLIFGQPPRVFAFPVSNLKSAKGSSESVNLWGKSGPDNLKIRVLDQHHVLISATTADPTSERAAGANASDGHFHSRAL